jgi:pimeloyl-ACP methyl ester carboxylesterase
MEKILTRNDVPIAYLDEGRGDTTLLFVHGAFIDKAYWEVQVDYFKTQYRVIAVDLPGHGRSGSNRTTWKIREYGKDICYLINELMLKNVVLIGHSLGGDVILEVAVQCPEAVCGFIGIDNFKNAATPLSDEMQQLSDAVLKMLATDFENTSEAYARKVLLSTSTNQAIADRVVADYRNMDKTIGIELIADCFSCYERERELMTQLTVKMHLIPVDNSPMNEEPLKKYAASGYEILPIKGTCHYPMLENPDELNRLIECIVLKIERK